MKTLQERGVEGAQGIHIEVVECAGQDDPHDGRRAENQQIGRARPLRPNRGSDRDAQ